MMFLWLCFVHSFNFVRSYRSNSIIDNLSQNSLEETPFCSLGRLIRDLIDSHKKSKNSQIVSTLQPRSKPILPPSSPEIVETDANICY